MTSLLLKRLKTIALAEIEEQLQKLDIPGISLALIENYEIRQLESAGFSQVEEEIKITKDTLFQCASISKVITAVLIMKLVENGALELQKSVNAYLRSWKLRNLEGEITGNVSIENLLSHSGSVTVHGFPGYGHDEKLPSLDEMLSGNGLANSEKVVVDGVPGKQYRYSGGGILVLQKLIEEVSGRDLQSLAQSAIFSPLEMTKSFFGIPSPETEIAWGYYRNKIPVSQGFQIYPELAAAGLWSTPEELAKLIIEMELSLKGASPKILTKKSVVDMLIPHFPTFMNSFIGKGIFVDSQDPQWFFHFGENLGYRCCMIGSVRDGSGMVVTTNSDDGFEIMKNLFRKFPFISVLEDYREIDIDNP